MRKYLKVLISILIIPCIFCSCSGVHYNSGEEKIGFSVSQTLMTENEDKLTTSIVFVENGMAETVFDFNMTSQYPLGIFDKINNSVFFIQNDDKGNDQLYVYTIDNKEVSQLTDSLYAVNNIFSTQNGAFLCAVDDYYVSPFYYDSNSDRIIKCINDDKFNVYAAAYCHEKNMLLVSGFDGDEDYAKTEKYNESETPVPYSVKNTVYLVSADSKKEKLLTADDYITSMAVNSELLIYRSCKFGDEETDIHYNVYNILSGEYENTHINIPKDAELLYLSNDSDKLYYLSAPDVNDKREIICYTISNGSSKIIYTPPENQYINNASAIING